MWLIETTGPEQSPCRITMCDCLKCPDCGAEVLWGFADTSTEKFDPNFQPLLNDILHNEVVVFCHESDGYTG